MKPTTQLYAKPENGNEIEIYPKTNYDLDVAAGKTMSPAEFTAEEKSKLNGLENYTHPDTHPATMIEQDAENQFVSEAVKNIYGADSISRGAKEGTATGIGSINYGSGNEVSNNFSAVTGIANTVTGMYNGVTGGENTVSGSHSAVSGWKNTVKDNFCAAFGSNNTVHRMGSFAAGEENEITGNFAVAMGYKNRATFGSAAFGYENAADKSNFAFAAGDANKATGFASSATGCNTEASGGQAHAEGNQTIASGVSSHAEGDNTKATGVFSHAEGTSATASGNGGSHAEGNSTTASGNAGSHAEGSSTVASGNSSHAEGNGTVAASHAQHVQGTYNVEDTEGIYAHIVGGGGLSEGQPEVTRRNIHTLTWTGDAWYSGDVVNGNGTGLNGLKEELQALLNSVAVITVENVEAEPGTPQNSWMADVTYPEGFTVDNSIITAVQYGYMNPENMWKNTVSGSDVITITQNSTGASVYYGSAGGTGSMKFRVMFKKF